MQSILQNLRSQIWGEDTSGKFTDRIGSVPLFDLMQGFRSSWKARGNAPEVNTSTHSTDRSNTYQFKSSNNSDDEDNGGNNYVDHFDPHMLMKATVKATPAQRYYSPIDVDEEDGEEYNDTDDEPDN
ncbi:hypothetical protein DPMN_044910 [Dreissena polymorpha]|uniref:Uncharacterized protein n=1 Tax=Dreissena polymorpha TaxID=45954 RepID=A0A9D4HZ85_DREPO|nr:hypothetical protein DPMN_044910 [Dreissena polymorpha]